MKHKEKQSKAIFFKTDPVWLPPNKLNWAILEYIKKTFSIY